MRRETLLSAAIGLVGFLRGPLTNLGTPPFTSAIRSILVRPHVGVVFGIRFDGGCGVAAPLLSPFPKSSQTHYSRFLRRGQGIGARNSRGVEFDPFRPRSRVWDVSKKRNGRVSEDGVNSAAWA